MARPSVTWTTWVLRCKFGTRDRAGGNSRSERLNGKLTPEVLEPIRRQLGVTNRVLDVLVAEVRLQRLRIVPRITGELSGFSSLV
jgi:hypothetical protein